MRFCNLSLRIYLQLKTWLTSSLAVKASASSESVIGPSNTRSPEIPASYATPTAHTLQTQQTLLLKQPLPFSRYTSLMGGQAACNKKFLLVVLPLCHTNTTYNANTPQRLLKNLFLSYTHTLSYTQWYSSLLGLYSYAIIKAV